MNISNPIYADASHSIINLTLQHPEFGDIEYAATATDSELFGRDLFARAVAGEFGPIAFYVAPALTIADVVRAHDEHLNSAARSRKYDNIHTAALRSAYPGPYHEEGVAFATWMDNCNKTGYQILAEVEAGTRQPPETIEEYLSLLPELVLPS